MSFYSQDNYRIVCRHIAHMHPPRTMSAVLMMLMLITAECCCDVSVSTEAPGMKTNAAGSRSTASLQPALRSVAGDPRHNAAAIILADGASVPLFAGVCCATSSNFFPAGRRRAGVDDSESANRAIFEGRMSTRLPEALEGQRMRKTSASYRLMASPTAGRVSAAGGAATSSTQPRNDAHQPDVPAKRLRRSTIDDDERQQRQRRATWKKHRDTVSLLRRLPSRADNHLADEDRSPEQVDSQSAVKLGEWVGEPEVLVVSIASRINKKGSQPQTYFVGKRHPANNDGQTLGFRA